MMTYKYLDSPGDDVAEERHVGLESIRDIVEAGHELDVGHLIGRLGRVHDRHAIYGTSTGYI